jgi:hypothetical protein
VIPREKGYPRVRNVWNFSGRVDTTVVTVVIVVKVVKQVQEADLKSNQRLDVLKS